MSDEKKHTEMLWIGDLMVGVLAVAIGGIMTTVGISVVNKGLALEAITGEPDIARMLFGSIASGASAGVTLAGGTLLMSAYTNNENWKAWTRD